MSRLIGSSFKAVHRWKNGPTFELLTDSRGPRLNEHLEPVHEELRSGTVLAQSLVLLFRAVSEAEERSDLPALDEALGLARRIARAAGEALRPEADRALQAEP